VSSPREGDLIAGRFELLSLIGEGGMGMVWLAKDLRLQRLVAIKLLKPAVILDRHARLRFLEEARIAAKLRHPHIVTIHDVGHKVPYIVQEYVEGEDLRKVLKRHPGGLPVPLFLKFATHIADGLVAAHHEKIVHRDIKPANVLVDAHDHAKVGDFGLSVVIDPTGGPQYAWIGTLHYLPPEQVQERPDARSDCYSLGCLYYEMATGRPPFSGSTPEAIIGGHKHGFPAPLTDYRSDLPVAVNQLIVELLGKRLDERPTAESVRSRLSALGS